MKKFFQTLRNIFSIEDLRTRILNTIGYLIIFRIGSFIALPGVNTTVLTDDTDGILGFLNTFLGGAFSNASIFGLGIMPYISASIIIQLLTVAVPYFQRMQKEGDSGRRRINQITRVLTIVITMAQGIGYVQTIPAEAIMIDTNLFTISAIILVSAGTIFCMWLGERITDKGIGNGISMLIMIGIISRFPGAIIAEVQEKGINGSISLLLEFVALFGVVMGTVMIVQAVRKIPVQYAKQMVGGKMYGGQRQYLPLKVNAAGVMPIIFAQALMFLPAMGAQIFAEDYDLAATIGQTFSNPYSWQYNLVFAIMIIIFTFFYTAITINPTQMADDMKRNNGFIPGIKPGKPTADFIDGVLSKITLPGSFLLAVVAILPAIAFLASVGQNLSYFYGGTSLLIMVGVILDTLQQIESYLLMRHYEGLMKSGRLKGRSQTAVA